MTTTIEVAMGDRYAGHGYGNRSSNKDGSIDSGRRLVTVVFVSVVAEFR